MSSIRSVGVLAPHLFGSNTETRFLLWQSTVGDVSEFFMAPVTSAFMAMVNLSNAICTSSYKMLMTCSSENRFFMFVVLCCHQQFYAGNGSARGGRATPSTFELQPTACRRNG